MGMGCWEFAEMPSGGLRWLYFVFMAEVFAFFVADWVQWADLSSS